jgi:hypothetical protein
MLLLQALGLEVRSVLAIGGIGGLAIGLAGREICENLLNGFLLMTTVRRSARRTSIHACHSDSSLRLYHLWSQWAFYVFGVGQQQCAMAQAWPVDSDTLHLCCTVDGRLALPKTSSSGLCI